MHAFRSDCFPLMVSLILFQGTLIAQETSEPAETPAAKRGFRFNTSSKKATKPAPVPLKTTSEAEPTADKTLPEGAVTIGLVFHQI